MCDGCTRIDDDDAMFSSVHSHPTTAEGIVSDVVLHTENTSDPSDGALDAVHGTQESDEIDEVDGAAVPSPARVETGDNGTVEGSSAMSSPVAPPTKLEAFLGDESDTDDICMPSLMDLGFSAATLAMLNHQDTKKPPLPSSADISVPTATPHANHQTPHAGHTVVQNVLDTSGTEARPDSAMIDALRQPTSAVRPARLRHVRAALDTAADDSDLALDISNLGIQSVHLMTATPFKKTGASRGAADGCSSGGDNDAGGGGDTVDTDTDMPVAPQALDYVAPTGSSTDVHAAPRMPPPGGNSNDVFAAVTPGEYGTMPVFVTLTLSLDDLNNALEDIRTCILATDAPVEDVFFTQTQLRTCCPPCACSRLCAGC